MEVRVYVYSPRTYSPPNFHFIGVLGLLPSHPLTVRFEGVQTFVPVEVGYLVRELDSDEYSSDVSLLYVWVASQPTLCSGYLT